MCCSTVFGCISENSHKHTYYDFEKSQFLNKISTFINQFTLKLIRLKQKQKSVAER